tara:strand:- start:410 stop:652 length:243 start_codon:yes stop_codon:yes gene_type:complete
MENLLVYFLDQVDSESRAINVFKHKTTNKDDLIATGSLNLCSNMAHITILPEHKEAYEDMEFDIVKAIEERDIMFNRILI